MKKALIVVSTAFTAAMMLLAQDASRFNGTWKGDGGQVRKLVHKNGVIYMEEQNTNGLLILRQYPTQGQEVTMTEGVWKDSKAVGKMDGNKLVVDTEMPTGMKWHDEWTMAPDGKSYAALRQMVAAGTGFPKAGGAPKGPAPAAGQAGDPGAGGPPAGGAPKGGGKAGSSNEPETFHRIE